jgi:hypothetical protein
MCMCLHAVVGHERGRGPGGIAVGRRCREQHGALGPGQAAVERPGNLDGRGGIAAGSEEIDSLGSAVAVEDKQVAPV